MDMICGHNVEKLHTRDLSVCDVVITDGAEVGSYSLWEVDYVGSYSITIRGTGILDRDKKRSIMHSLDIFLYKVI